MTYTSHGHWIPGTPTTDSLGSIEVIPCGGPRSCDDCIAESAEVYYADIKDSKQLLSELPVLDTPVYRELTEVPLQVQHRDTRMMIIGKALIDMEALKKAEVEPPPDHELVLVIACHFRFESIPEE